MNNYEKGNIQTHTAYQIFFIRLMCGLKKIITQKKLMAVALIILALETAFLNSSDSFITPPVGQLALNPALVKGTLKILLGIIFLMTDIFLVLLLATPFVTFRHKRAFQKIGLVNRAQEPPELLTRDKRNGIDTYEYYTNGIPWTRFDEEKEFIEASLNLSIVSIYQGKDKTRVIIKAMNGSVQLPDMIKWSDSYLQQEQSKIVLGQGIGELKVIDLDITPHIQCGGITGSGKTVLLKCVLHQLYLHNVSIYLCDFKGYVDFSMKTRSLYHCVDTKEDLNRTLDILLSELEERKSVFSAEECTNITEYNHRHPNFPYQRIFLASDEIAYAFQKRGLPTKEKALAEEIEAKMTLIAQQGRFAGIHLWLSTQRGDADTIPPQIRSNLNIRICGRASELLSRVTIDNALASQIPNHIRGRFVDDNEEFFQAFYYEE